jgi:hypothetical protein
MAMDLLNSGSESNQPMDLLGGSSQPNLNIPQAPVTASADLLNKIKQASVPAPQATTMQEQTSNPTAQPGFNNLSKQDQLQRIAFSQFDPANQNNVGGGVPPGALDSNSARMAASIIPTALQPELSMGDGMFARYVVNPLMNSAARIGTGTASNLGYAAPNIHSMQDFRNVGQESVGLNSLLEAGTLPFRAGGYAAEMSNPLNYSAQKSNEINTEFNAAQAAQQAIYAPVFARYGENTVTTTPQSYLGFTPAITRRFTPNINKSYRDFIDEPSFQNLHNLQSQMGKDASSMSGNTNKINTYQTLNNARQSVQGRIQGYLSQDPNALSSYNAGTNITRDLVEPYRSSNALQNISSGAETNASPSDITNAIQKGIVDRSIPANHPLVNHMNDLNNAINFGKAAQYAIPALVGGLGGQYIHPGLGGALGGASGVLGASQIAGMASKFGAPSLTGFVQNPMIQSLFENYLRPAYYGAGRTTINAFNQNKQ